MNYIIIYLEVEHLLNFLTQEEKGDFLDLLISYGKNQELPKIENKKLLNVFNFMKGRLDTQFEKAKLKAETAKKNGATGGRPVKDIKPSNNPTKPKDNPDKPKKTQSVFSKPTIKEIDIPKFIDKNLFVAFVEMRIKIKKPLTEVATDLLIKKLTKFESKQVGLANQALENSIESSYQGVFEPKINNSTQKPTGMPKPRYDDPDYYKNDGGWND